MTSASALMDNVAVTLFQNLKEGMEAGRITNMDTAQIEVEAAIAELDRRRLPEEPTNISDLVGKLFLEIGSLNEKVARCEAQLAEFQCLAKTLKEDTTMIIARTETCNSLVEQQQKENAKVLAAVEVVKTSVSNPSSSCAAPAPAPSLPPPVSPAAYSTNAVVSFPGGPRTITIHPPDSPNYQSIIRDGKGDVIIDFRRKKELRREGAFRGPLEKVDWAAITRVSGRAPDPQGPRVVPPVPLWSDASQPSSCPPPSRKPSDLIVRRRQLSTSTHTGAFGRVLEAPSAPACASPSSHESSQDPQSSSNAILESIPTPFTPPSPSLGRGRKRARSDDDGEDVLLTPETLLMETPVTPTPVKREEIHTTDGPAKRKRLRSLAHSEGLSNGAGSLCRTRSVLDLTRMA